MLYGWHRANRLIARVDGRAPRFERDGLRPATVGGESGGVEQRVRVAERGAGAGGTAGTREAARGAVIDVMPAIGDGSGADKAIAPGAFGQEAGGHGEGGRGG